jgi:hypothetical protein
MYIVLIYVPDNDDGDSPFDGIEVALLTSDKAEAERYIEQTCDEHADWHFYLAPLTASN